MVQPSHADRAVSYRTVNVDGVEVFYREAGAETDPTLVLLHGYPSSSHMYRDLIPRLAEEFHVIAPDYPGFGHSDRPALDEFEYTFDHLAEFTASVLQNLDATPCAFFIQDYGAPVGFRIAVEHTAELPRQQHLHRSVYTVPNAHHTYDREWHCQTDFYRT
jgi:pimeloyl-ACP methyl ester carboxylesterase